MDDADPRDPETHSGEPEPSAPDPGAPTSGGSGADSDADAPDGATVEHPRLDDTLAGPDHSVPADPWSGHDETVIGAIPPVDEVGPTGTGILPVVPPGPDPTAAPSGAEPSDVGSTQPAPPRWSARAQVPTPGQDEEYAPDYWDGGDEPPRRGALLPALFAAAVVLLLAIIGFGIWLAVHNRSNPSVPNNPASSTTLRTSGKPSASVSTSAAAPTTTAPATVAIPNLSGRTPADAATALNGLGLTVGGQTQEPSSTIPAGQVIRTNPAAGAAVAPGSAVDLIISSGPPPTTPPPSPVVTGS